MCYLQKALVGEQKMADLPSDHVISNEPPFTRVGTDYFGPIEEEVLLKDMVQFLLV